MKRIPAKSTNLKSVGYDLNISVLEVEFHDKRVYQYLRVPLIEYQNLMAAFSKGSYFAQRIKDNKKHGCRQIYPITRVLRQ